MPQITLTLSLEDTNLVLEALGQAPYARVYELIATIHQQAQAQLADALGNGSGDRNDDDVGRPA